jgi:hypothetical protein
VAITGSETAMMRNLWCDLLAVCVMLLLGACSAASYNTHREGSDQTTTMKTGGDPDDDEYPCDAGTACTIDIAKNCNGNDRCEAGVPSNIVITGTNLKASTSIQWVIPANRKHLRFAGPGIVFEDDGFTCTVATDNKSCTCIDEAPARKKKYKYAIYLVKDPWVVNR